MRGLFSIWPMAYYSIYITKKGLVQNADDITCKYTGHLLEPPQEKGELKGHGTNQDGQKSVWRKSEVPRSSMGYLLGKPVEANVTN